MAHYDPDHDFAPLIKYLTGHPELEPLDWQYMGHRPYRKDVWVATYRARETPSTPPMKVTLTPEGDTVN